MDVQPVEIDPNFEPQTRVRSNTWPCRPREVIADAQCSPVSDESVSGDGQKPENLGHKTKSSSRRNAWGNLSYADLITKAIQNSPEQRLTLSQIYDWMVQNVPYFKDKGDSTSSAGWKNSIRHNLSLHSRFMRIQNEGTGKSSWWVLNPDAKPGKTPRRRAGSMETKSYEKRRGRVKKKVEAVRAAMENIMNGSPSSDDFLDSPLGFQLSPEFRPRASSNASSCGRLSPIQAANEPDLHDSQVPPMSPIPWGSELESVESYDQLGQYDQLVDTLVDGMKIGDSKLRIAGENNGINTGLDQTDIEMMYDGTVPLTQLLTNPDRINLTNVNLSQYSDQSANIDNAQYRNLPAPPAYPGDSMRRSPQQQQQQSMDQIGLQSSSPYNELGLPKMASGNMRVYGGQPNSVYPTQDSLMIPGRMNPQINQLNVNTQQQISSPARSPQQSHQQISPNYGNQRSYGSPQQSPQNKQISSSQLQSQAQQQANERSLLQRCLEAPTDSLLRAALTQKTQGFINMADMANTSPYNNIDYENRQMPTGLQLNNNGLNNNLLNMPLQQNRSMAGMLNASNLPPQQQLPMPSQSVPAHKPPSSNSLNEIAPDFFDQEFDMDQMVQHELSLEGSLDFNFDPTSNNTDTSQNLVR